MLVVVVVVAGEVVDHGCHSYRGHSVRFDGLPCLPHGPCWLGGRGDEDGGVGGVAAAGGGVVVVVANGPLVGQL